MFSTENLTKTEVLLLKKVIEDVHVSNGDLGNTSSPIADTRTELSNFEMRVRNPPVMQ
jgi:hypothetical protein